MKTSELILKNAQARRANAERNVAAILQVIGFAENRGFQLLAEAAKSAVETARAERDATEDEVDELLLGTKTYAMTSDEVEVEQRKRQNGAAFGIRTN